MDSITNIKRMLDRSFKVKCIKVMEIQGFKPFFTIDKEYDAFYHPTRTDFYFVKDDRGIGSYKPTNLFEPTDIVDAKEIEEYSIKELEYWNSIRMVVCITKEYKGVVYDGVIVGETYDVVKYMANSHPNGRFRIKGNDSSEIYPRELFITIDQHRQNQLEKILG